MEMKFLKNLWAWLVDLPKLTLVMIILLLCIAVLLLRLPSNLEKSFQLQEQLKAENKDKQEKYVLEISPKLDKLLTKFLYQDTLASNIMILNYHNSIVSAHGLAYRYITCIKEEFRNEPCIDYWKELDFLNYEQEILKISRNSLSNLGVVEANPELPHLTHLLKLSSVKHAIFYPILGLDDIVGLIVVLYPDKYPVIDLYYLWHYIMPVCLPLGSLLDYNNQLN